MDGFPTDEENKTDAATNDIPLKTQKPQSVPSRQANISDIDMLLADLDLANGECSNFN